MLCSSSYVLYRLVSIAAWNEPNDKKTILIDVRNDIEILIGSFKDAINPNIKNFTQFKDFEKTNLNVTPTFAYAAFTS